MLNEACGSYVHALAYFDARARVARACFAHLRWLRVAALTAPRGHCANVRCRCADVELTLMTLGRECRCALLRSGCTQDEEELL